MPRIDLYAPTGRDDDYYQWGSMAGACRSYGVVTVRIKSDVASWPEGRTQEKYCVEPGTYSGIILLYSTSTSNGEPLALLQDGYLQHVRVGAAAGIGVDVLARPDAVSLGLIGSGGMAWSYLEADRARARSAAGACLQHDARSPRAVRGARPYGARVRGRRRGHRGAGRPRRRDRGDRHRLDDADLRPGLAVARCARHLRHPPRAVARARRPGDRVLQLGVNTVPAGTPVPGMEWKAGGIAAYVSGQPDERARIPASSRRETGAFPTLTDLHRGRVPGRTSPEEVTLFVTTGTQGLQFGAVGGHVWQRARERDLGTPFPTEWFLQDIRD